MKKTITRSSQQARKTDLVRSLTDEELARVDGGSNSGGDGIRVCRGAGGVGSDG